MSITASLRRAGFYAARLRKEKITKLLAVSMASLALVLQLTAGVFPVAGNTAMASSNNNDNIIYQGVKNQADLLAVYDRGSDNAGHKDIKQIYSQFGVTRADLANTKMASYKTNDFNGQLKTLSRVNWANSGRSAVTITATGTTIYTGPFLNGANSQGFVMPALVGKRAVDGQWFAITLDCGNLVYVVPPKPPTPPAPKPAAVCSSLEIQTVSRTSFNLVAAASVSGGATVKGFHYVVTKDGKTVTDRVVPTTGLGSQINIGYNDEGTYTAKVTVQTSVGDVTSANCAKTFTITPAPATPVYTCDSLSVVKIDRTNARFSGNASATGGAKIVSYTFAFGDGTTKTVTNPADVAHTYAKAGTYNATLTVTVTVNGQTKTVTGDNCKAAFTVTPEECLPGVPVGDEKCTPPVEKCDVPGKENLPKDSADCVATPVTPPELPQTGAGALNTASSVLGLGSVVTSIGYYVSSRRSLLSSLLGR